MAISLIKKSIIPLIPTIPPVMIFASVLVLYIKKLKIIDRKINNLTKDKKNLDCLDLLSTKKQCKKHSKRNSFNSNIATKDTSEKDTSKINYSMSNKKKLLNEKYLLLLSKNFYFYNQLFFPVYLPENINNSSIKQN